MSEKLPAPGSASRMARAEKAPHPNRSVRIEMSLHATHRDAGQVTVVDLSGRIVLGDGSALLRKTIRGLLEDQRKLILLNLADVDYIDSSGIGELVIGYTAEKN